VTRWGVALGGVLSVVVGVGAVMAQNAVAPAPIAPIPPGPAAPTPAPSASAPAAPSAAPQAPAAPDAANSEDDAAANAVAKPPPPKLPPPPPQPVRTPGAVLRVLDKVTAETLAFEAPIGRRVRYKSLVFVVKTCVTRGLEEAQPRPSAYLVITSDAGARRGTGEGAREVFHGWMFANDPSVNAMHHPVFDAWLVSCSTATPPG